MAEIRKFNVNGTDVSIGLASDVSAGFMTKDEHKFLTGIMGDGDGSQGIDSSIIKFNDSSVNKLDSSSNYDWKWAGNETGTKKTVEQAINVLAKQQDQLETRLGQLVYDITEHTGQKYATLSDALNNGTNVPLKYRKGGMNVKFVCSFDNKYVSFFNTSSGWSTSVSDWQGVDETPTAGSKNLAESGGIKECLTTNLKLTYSQNAIDSHDGRVFPYNIRVLMEDYISAPFQCIATGNLEFRLVKYNKNKKFIELTSIWSKLEKITSSDFIFRILFRLTTNEPVTPSDVESLFSIDLKNEYLEKNTVRFDIEQNLSDSEKLQSMNNMGLISYMQDFRDIQIQTDLSANIHNSAPATTSSTEPTDGSDWKGHVLRVSKDVVTIAENELYNTTAYIAITGGVSYKSLTAIRRLVWYKSDKSFISEQGDGSIPEGTELQAPITASFVRFSYNNTSYTPEEVKFGKYVDNIDVPYSYDIKDYDKNGNRLALYSDITLLQNEIDLIDIRKEIKVLLMGSSLGVNTIIQFPYLVESCGVNIVCGNTYIGSGTLQDYADKCGTSEKINTGIYRTIDGNWSGSSKTIQEVLDYCDWDIIILQRGAAESYLWTSEMSNALGDIIDYIKSNTNYTPKIMFNSTFARSLQYFYTKDSLLVDSRQLQINYTKQVMVTAKQMQEEYGIEVLPVAIAIQNARNTVLAMYGSYNGDDVNYSGVPDLNYDITHADIGVGSYILGATLLEQIITPMFNVQTIANAEYPSASELITRGVWTAAAYTSASSITNYFRIANACALSAVRHPWELNKVLPFKYEMPNIDPNALNLDIDYTSTYYPTQPTG